MALAVIALSFLQTGCETLESARKTASDTLGNGRVFAWYGYEGRFTGQATPLAAGCGDATQAGMTIGGGQFALDPFSATTVIAGTLNKDGSMAGILTRFSGVSSGANLPGPQADAAKSTAHASRQVLSIAFLGQASTDAAGQQHITGTLTSGPCRWSVSLKRV